MAEVGSKAVACAAEVRTLRPANQRLAPELAISKNPGSSLASRPREQPPTVPKPTCKSHPNYV